MKVFDGKFSAGRWLAAVAVLAGALACAPADAAAAAPSEFVKTRGTSFVVAGQEIRVAGVNNHYLTFGSRREVTRVLDDAVAMGANVVRTFIQPIIGAPDGSVATIWNWKSEANSSNLGSHGVYMAAWNSKLARMEINDGANGLQHLDFVLSEARNRNLRVIVGFLDFWGYMGGAQQFSAWYGSSDKYTFFAQDPRTRQSYKDWVRHVIMRVNTLNGIAYRNDTAIFSWELMNEPDIQPAALLRDWLSEMSGFVKELDRNHLLATGHANLIHRLSDLDLPNIDFGTWHGYPVYERLSVEQFDDLIPQFCAIGKTADKPVILEEFGLAKSDPRQAEAYRMWLGSIRNNPDCAGWVVWRLVSRQDSGDYPADHDGFDIVNDGGPTWTALKEAASPPRPQGP